MSRNRYINAEMWLHGSCKGKTEGLCGNWNDDPKDDQTKEFDKIHDEDCPSPTPPAFMVIGEIHPCEEIDGYDEAERICRRLMG